MSVTRVTRTELPAPPGAALDVIRTRGGSWKTGWVAGTHFATALLAPSELRLGLWAHALAHCAQPGESVVVISGDVDGDEALEQARDLFSCRAPGSSRPAMGQGMRSVPDDSTRPGAPPLGRTAGDPADSIHFEIQLPPEEEPALAFLGEALAGGPTSIWGRAVVETGIARAITHSAPRPGTLRFEVLGVQKADLARRALHRALEAVLDQGLPPGDRERTRSALRTEWLETLSRTDGRSRWLGASELLGGDARRLPRFSPEPPPPEKLRRVSVQVAEALETQETK